MADDIAYVGDTSGDEQLNVIFSNRLDENGDSVEYIHIDVPGDKFLTVDTQLTDYYRNRFRRKYQEWKGFQAITGTPIEDWHDIPEGMRAEFKYMGFHYVEQVAKAPDAAFGRIMGSTSWRNKAIKFLEGGKVSAEQMIADQAKIIAEMQAQLAELTAAKRPGRKPKEDALEE